MDKRYLELSMGFNRYHEPSSELLPDQDWLSNLTSEQQYESAKEKERAMPFMTVIQMRHDCEQRAEAINFV